MHLSDYLDQLRLINHTYVPRYIIINGLFVVFGRKVLRAANNGKFRCVLPYLVIAISTHGRRRDDVVIYVCL